MNVPEQCGSWCGMVFGAVLVLYAAVPVSAGIVSSNTVFSDDFEAQTLWYPSSTDADPGPSPVGDGWTVDEGADDKVRVYSNASSEFDTLYGDKYLRLWRDSGNCIAYGDFTLGAPPSHLSLAQVSLEFDFYRDTDGAFLVGLFDGANQMSYIGMTTDGGGGQIGGACRYTGSSWVKLTELNDSNPADQWIHAKMVVDFGTDTYSMTIGTKTATGLPLWGDFSTASRLRFHCGGGWASAKYGIDNVEVTALYRDEIFLDDFEAQALYYPSSNDADPGPSIAGNGWTVDEGADDKVRVYSNASSEFDTLYGDKYLRLYRDSGNCIAYGDFTLGAPASQLSLDFDFYRDTDGGMNVGFYDGDTQVNALVMTVDQLGLPGRAGNLQGGSWVRVPALDDSNPADQWIHAKMVVHFGTDTYSMTIGTKTATGLPILGDFSTASRVRFAAGGGWEHAKYGIDNVEVNAVFPQQGTILVIR